MVAHILPFTSPFGITHKFTLAAYLTTTNASWRAGVVLAYSNSVAGKLADYTQQRGLGNVGCFYGGMVAVTLAGLVLFICSRFLDLGKEELVTTKKGVAKLKPSKGG